MDRWKFYDITHRDHVLCNPVSVAKADGVIALLALQAGARVIDIGCGKGEVLIRLVERYRVRGVGVDISPYSIRDAHARVRGRVPEADLTFLEMDGAAYAAEAESFDLAMCLGASWIFRGHRGTLRALARFTRPAGLVLVGEPFWKKEPDPEYLAADRMTRDEFSTHPGNITASVDEGLIPLYAIASREDEWDEYEGLQWQAAERQAAEHPEDPDVPALLERVRHDRDIYLRWGRETLGWALYLFRKPA